MGQHVFVLVFPKDWVLFPALSCWLITTCYSNPRVSAALFQHQWTPSTLIVHRLPCWQTRIHVCVDIKHINKKYCKKSKVNIDAPYIHYKQETVLSQDNLNLKLHPNWFKLCYTGKQSSNQSRFPNEEQEMVYVISTLIKYDKQYNAVN